MDTTEGDRDELTKRPRLGGRFLKILTLTQIQQIDDALAALGPYAEVKLIKNKGKLRFIEKTESESLS